MDNLKLQLSYRADNLATIELVDEQLGDALIHQLVDTLLQLLGTHGIIIDNIFEHLGREGRQPTEMQLFAIRQRVANLEGAIVGKPHNVTWPCLIDGAFALSHELRGGREAYRLAESDVQIGLIAYKLPTTNFAESNTRAVVGVDVGCNLEDKSREFLFLWHHLAFLCLCGFWGGGNLHKAIQEFLYTEIVEGRAEEDGSNLGRAVGLHVKVRVHTTHQFKIFAQLVCIVLANPCL